MTSDKPGKWVPSEEMARQITHTAKYGTQSYIHPLLAKQILRDYRITDGECLDIGAGNALLSINLAKNSNLRITALDKSPRMVELAGEEISSNGLGERIDAVQSAAEDMPFDDNRFDLIVSKGTLWFFDDKVKAFSEIYRVLKPGGVTYIGCGDPRRWPGNPSDFLKMVRFRIDMQKKKFQEEWKKLRLPRSEWDIILRQAGIENYRYHPGYLWIEIRK